MEAITMNKDKVYLLNDYEFKEIIESSVSINQVAKKLGFANIPGKSSKLRIKNRILSLNLKLKEKEKAERYEKKPSKYSNTTELGNIGESKFIFDCALYGVNVLKPMFNNLPYDFVIETKNGFKKVQVKTSEYLQENKKSIRFHIAEGTSYLKGNRKHKAYDPDTLDYFYLFNVEINKGFLVPYISQTDINIRLERTLNNQEKKINYYENYTFEKIIVDLL
jgi:hypothetical protein